jgi:catechol 2,3-dioxygenase-like lactoylglutathione lyase family enzyme
MGNVFVPKVCRSRWRSFASWKRRPTRRHPDALELVRAVRVVTRVGPVPQLNAIGIVTSDMASSIRFYRLLGLDVPETPDEGHVDTFLPNGVRFMLDSEDTIRTFRPEWTRETGNQLGLAFECESAAEVDNVYARMVEAGFDGEKEPWDAFWGQRYAQLRDPDGVGVDLYASL